MLWHTASSSSHKGLSHYVDTRHILNLRNSYNYKRKRNWERQKEEIKALQNFRFSQK